MPKPHVTGISPKEGYPGTKVIIRGENLGRDETDLVSVKICGVDCTLRSRWEKESRITTYTGFCMGKGDIIVVTKSGGIGTSTVGFQGLVKKNIGANEESAIWIDEDVKSFLTGMKRSAVSELRHDNPLGISLDESSKLSADFLEREFPNSSIDITKENFNSMRFLIENYQNAKYEFSFEDLKSGLNHMKDKIGSKTVSSSDALIKNNISSFMDAIKIMKDIHYLSSIDKKKEFSKNIEFMLKDILKTSHKIYDQDLASKDRADMIRSSLQILDTYKSAIYFPQNVDKALREEDYEQIITSYKLAQLQLSKAETSTRKSRLFEQIRAEMDKKIVQVQQRILEKLVQFPSNPDDQKFLIDYYATIEELSGAKKPNGTSVVSPIWYCLEEEKKWFVQLMIECRDMHIADEKVSLALKQSADSSDSSSSTSKQSDSQQGQQQRNGQDTSQIENNQQQANLINNSGKSQTLTAAEAAKIQAMTPVPQERNKFIEELCQMFFDIFSDYWKLGSMCLSNMNMPVVPQKSRSSGKGQTTVAVVGGNAADSAKTFDDFYTLVSEILTTFSDIVRAAFIPHTFRQGDGEGESTNDDKMVSGRALFQAWPIKHDEKIISQILPHCLRVCRMCAMQINSLEIPIQLFETIQSLIYDLRCECLKILLATPTREILATLGFEEQDWIVDRDIDPENNSCLITNLPMKFEAKVTKALNLSKEFVLDDRKGEKALFRDSAFIKKIAMLLYGIIHALLKRITRFMNQEDPLPKFVQISRSKLLLYLYNNLSVCKRTILPNIWDIIAQHKYKLTDQVIKESKKDIKELQEILLVRYMKETVQPIVDQIEVNLYAGRYDFNDSSPPISIRNYIKIIIMSLLNIHSELFLLNKALIIAVFTYAVKEIYTKLFELFSNVPQFSANAAVQTHVDIFCLKETFKLYANDEAKEIMLKTIKLIPTSAFERNRTLMTNLINDFQRNMQPYIAVFQQQPPPSSVQYVLQQQQQQQLPPSGSSSSKLAASKKSDEIVL